MTNTHWQNESKARQDKQALTGERKNLRVISDKKASLLECGSYRTYPSTPSMSSRQPFEAENRPILKVPLRRPVWYETFGKISGFTLFNHTAGRFEESKMSKWKEKKVISTPVRMSQMHFRQRSLIDLAELTERLPPFSGESPKWHKTTQAQTQVLALAMTVI